MPFPTYFVRAGATHTAMPIFRTIDNLLASSGVMRAAAASGVMFAAASCLACFNLDSGVSVLASYWPIGVLRLGGDARIFGSG